MIEIIIDILFLALIVIQHELVHYFVARYYKINARIKLTKNKEINNKVLRILNLGLPFPSVKLNDIENYKQLNVTLLAPLPFGFINAANYLILTTASDKTIQIFDWWITICLIFAFSFSVFLSSGDLLELYTQYKIRDNIAYWFKINMD